MRSTSVGVSLALVSAAASVYALPISTPETNDLAARLALSPATIAKSLGGGLLTGGAFSGLLGLLNGTSLRRDSEDVEVLKRELETRLSLPVGTIGKELGKGLLTGGAFAGLLGLLNGTSLRRDSEDVEVLKRQLETRLSLPVGTIGKELGKGLLTGGAFAGLLGLLNGTETRDLSSEGLEARGGLASVVEKLIGAGETDLGDVLKNAAIGGAASGAANNVVSGIIGSREPQAAALGKVAGEAVEDGLGSTIGKGILGGIGSAIGGSVIGEAFSHLFNRSLTDDQLTQLVGAMIDTSDVQKREPQLGKVAGEAVKDSLGTTVGKGLISGIGSAIGGTAVGAAIENLFNRDLTDDQLIQLLQMAQASNVEERAIGSVGKGVAGLVAGLGASTLAGDALDKIESLFKRRDLTNDQLIQLLQMAQVSNVEERALGSVGKGVAGVAAGLGASTLVGEALDKIESLFKREVETAWTNLLARELGLNELD